MPVQIDEMTAEVEPAPAAPAPPPPNPAAPPSPETELCKQRDLLARLDLRAARVRAD
jgi:hypothetical protein